MRHRIFLTASSTVADLKVERLPIVDPVPRICGPVITPIATDVEPSAARPSQADLEPIETKRPFSVLDRLRILDDDRAGGVVVPTHDVAEAVLRHFGAEEDWISTHLHGERAAEAEDGA